MLRRFVLFVLLVASPLVGRTFAGTAEILGYLPEDTLTFALVRDAQKTNEKIVEVLSIFSESVPAPLDIALAMTGLSQGLELNGDIVFALLPASGPAGVPAPVFLLPVSDYPKFAEVVRGDATGEICRVTIAGEDVLVAKQGDYAVLMNVEHRDLMQQLLQAGTAGSLDLEEHREWLEANDVSAMVTATGVAFFRKSAEEQSAKAASDDSAQLDQPPIAGEMLHLGDSLPFVELFTREVQTVGLGLAIDESTNSRVRWTVKFAKEKTESTTEKAADTPFLGFEDKLYALAGNGGLPVEFTALLPDIFTDLSRTTAVQDGRQEFTENDWADVRRSYELWTRGLGGLSFLLTPGKEGEPLLAILFTRLTVDDASRYLESLKQSFELSNELNKRSKSDIRLQFDVAPVTVANAKGIVVTCDLDKATGDGDQHIWQALLTSVVGIDHKLSLYFCATDNKQVFFAMESQDKLAEFIDAWRKRSTGLAQNAQVMQTVEIMEKDSTWRGLVNPQGFVELVRTAMKSVQILGFVPEFPLYPTAPPLGMTLSADPTTWRGEFVMPVQAARAMAEFTKEIEAVFR